MECTQDKIKLKVSINIANKKRSTQMNQKARLYNKQVVMLINKVINDLVYIINL